MASKPVIVIIPGGFCSPRAYDKLASSLRNSNYETNIISLTTCTANPAVDSSSEGKPLAERSPFDDAKRVHETIKPLLEQGREVVLVGHSYGSLPMLASCQGWTTSDRKEKGLEGGIKGIVYLAGFTHSQRNKGIMGNTDYLPIMPYHKLQDGILELQDDAIPLFFSDMPEEDRAKAAGDYTLKYMTRSAFAFYPEYIDADVPVPKTWILPEEDKVVAPEYQQMFVQGGQVQHVAKIKGGHFAFLSDPEETAAAIDEAAKR